MSFKPPSRYRSMTSTSAGSIGIRRSSANLVRSSPISASTRAPVESASPPKLVMTRSRDGSETPPLPRGGPRRRSTPCRARPAAPVRAYPSRPRPEVVDARICVVQLLSRRQSRRCRGCGQLIASTGRGRSPGGEWRRWPGVGREGASLQTSDHVVKRSAPDQQPPCRLVATREAIAAESCRCLLETR